LFALSARFPPAASWSRKQGDVRGPVIQEIERQASEAWGMGRAIAAVDYMQVVVPGVVRPNDMSSNPGLEFGNAAASEDPEHGGSGERSGNKRKRARVRKALGADYDVGGGDGGDDDDDSRAG
jgi:ribonuclease Z